MNADPHDPRTQREARSRDRAMALAAAVRFASGVPPARLIDLAEAFQSWIVDGDRTLVDGWAPVVEPEPLEVGEFDKGPALERARARRAARREAKVAEAAAMMGGEE